MEKKDFENLMVGDWIMYLSDKPENAFPIQVTAEMFTDDFVKWPDRFAPILITEDIVKSIFDRWDGGYGWIDFDYGGNCKLQYYLHEFRLSEYYFYFGSEPHSINPPEVLFRCSCRYVHELQHAFKLLHFNKKIELC